MIKIFLIFGDSIAYGSDDIKGGWAARLRLWIDDLTLSDSGSYFRLLNLAIGGDNTENLLKRFDFEARQRLDEEVPSVIVFAIGINDSQIFKGQNKTLAEKFENNIKELAKKAEKISNEIVFIGLTPVDEKKTVPVAWHKDKSYENEDIKNYNKIIKKICEENKLYFIDIFNKLNNLNYKNSLSDGLHPGSEGHEIIFNAIKEYLKEKKII